MKYNFNCALKTIPLQNGKCIKRKIKLAIFLLCMCANGNLFSQDAITIPGKVWYHVLDATATPSGAITANQDLNSTLAAFNVTASEQVFPFAKSHFLRDTYQLTCNCDEELLMNALRQNHSNLVNEVEPVFEDQMLDNPADWFWQSYLIDDTDWMWYIDITDANDAWDLTHGSACVKVAVKEPGVDLLHPDLVGKIDPPYDFYSGGSLVGSGFGYEHGNHVMGLICSETTDAGNIPNGASLSIGYNTKVMATKSSGLQSMLYASTILKADIISVSWYSSCSSTAYMLAVEQEINDNGTLIVKAAGNMLSDFTNHCGGGGLYPFSGFEDDRTVIVSGSWKNDNHAAILDWNYDGDPDIVTHNHNAAVDFCAPSYQIVSLYATVNGGVVSEWPYGGMGGTSQSAPITAATAALMKSVNPCMNNLDMAKLLEQTTYPLLDASDYPGQVGTGRLNAYGAVFASLPYGTINPISSNVTWSDADKYVSTDVLVESGTLTITGTVRFANDARLIIKPGAKVVVDGGLLTASKCSCSDNLYWPGIEVWGQSTERQLSTLQGTLELRNGAIIEHAGCAVRLGNLTSTNPWTYDWGKTGGIVKVTTNSIFRNNRKDVEFLAYQNYYISNGNQVPKKNVSFFHNTEFLVDEVLPNVTNLSQRVSLYDVDGIRFRSCNFHIEGDALTNYSIQNRGTGIYSLASSFEVNSRCSVTIPLGSECDPGYLTAETLGEPGSDIIPSQFSNYLLAIRSIGADGFSNTSVSGTIFRNNEMGIFLKTVDQASIKRNRFFIDEQDYFIAFGAHLLACTGYAVERNIFEGTGDLDELNTGIWISDSDDESNEMYLNDFIGLFAGSIAQGIQVDEDNDYEGLEMLCGLYDNSKYNLAVVEYTDDNGKIALRQGDMAIGVGDETGPAGNLFTQTNWSGNPAFTDYYICPYPDCDPIIYEHHNSASPWPVVPVEIDPLQVETSDNLPEFITREQSCPVGKGIIHSPEHLHSLVLYKRLKIEEIKRDLEGLIDGGNTSTVVTFINDVNNNSATLRSNLLPLTPYLSDDVLSALIDRQQQLNPWHLCELLIACSPLKPEVWSKVENTNQLSDFLFGLLSAYQDGTNSKDAKESELKQAELEKAHALNSYIRTQLTADEENYYLEEVKELMTGDDIKREIRKKVAILLQENNHTEAANLLTQYEEDPDREVWKQYMEILLSIDAAGGYHAATTSHITSLETLAETGKYGYQHARALLEVLTGVIPEEEYNLPGDGGGLKSLKVRESVRRPSLVGVYPNPAQGEFYITYVLPTERESAFVNIFDLQGKLVQSENITAGYGILSLNAKHFAAGSYVFELELNGQKVATEKFQIVE